MGYPILKFRKKSPRPRQTPNWRFFNLPYLGFYRSIKPSGQVQLPIAWSSDRAQGRELGPMMSTWARAQGIVRVCVRLWASAIVVYRCFIRGYRKVTASHLGIFWSHSCWKYSEQVFPKLRSHYFASWDNSQIQSCRIEVPQTQVLMISGLLETSPTLGNRF